MPIRAVTIDFHNTLAWCDRWFALEVRELVPEVLLALGSGDPTRAICSTLIAEAFQSVGYPILPDVSRDPDHPGAREILHIRHHSLYAPRDFDLSPYFAIVKPALTDSFDFHRIRIDRTPATGSTLHR